MRNNLVKSLALAALIAFSPLVSFAAVEWGAGYDSATDNFSIGIGSEGSGAGNVNGHDATVIIGDPYATGTYDGTQTQGKQTPKCGTDGQFREIGGVCFPINTGLSGAPIYVILSNIFSWLMGIFTTLAVIAFVISGVQYLTSTGDQDQIDTAKRNAKYALIGVIVGLSGFVIVRAIASALSGQGFFF